MYKVTPARVRCWPSRHASPRRARAAPVFSSASALPAGPGRCYRPVILVVDDDRDARVVYGGYLRAMGCEVFVAQDGAVAIEKATSVWPDVIVMDLAMPRVDGWAATARLKESSWTRGIPIVALSAIETAGESARAAGCDAFIAKPCLPELLWWHVRRFLKDEPRQ